MNKHVREKHFEKRLTVCEKYEIAVSVDHGTTQRPKLTFFQNAQRAKSNVFVVLISHDRQNAVSKQRDACW